MSNFVNFIYPYMNLLPSSSGFVKTYKIYLYIDFKYASVFDLQDVQTTA